MRFVLFAGIVGIAVLPAFAVTVCTDANGKKTYTDYDHCSKLNLQEDKKLEYIRTKPKHCGSLADNVATLNKLADQQERDKNVPSPVGKAIAQVVRGQAKPIENRYDRECVRK